MKCKYCGNELVVLEDQFGNENLMCLNKHTIETIDAPNHPSPDEAAPQSHTTPRIEKRGMTLLRGA